MKNESATEGENARLRGDLLTIGCRINHDLRTPLGGIVAAGEMLREILAENKLPSGLMDPIFDSVDELTRLIKQVSFVAKASANPIPKKTVRMGEIVAGVLQRLESRILKKKATITEPNSWPEIEGVASWLEVVWWNFLSNALQHAGEKLRIELNWRKENGGSRFQICDNGGGVPDEIRAGLFQPFHLLHEPASARGLGLSVVQRLIELQNGNCGYEPKSGGACFFFFLPDN